MNVRSLRLAVSLLLALAAVALSGWSVVRKVQSFQPLGFEASAAGSSVDVRRVTDPRTGLEPGDQIFFVEKNEVAGPAVLVQSLRSNPETNLTVLRGPEVVVVRYQRPPLHLDIPYLILALIGAVYLLIGLYTLLRQGTGQGFLFYLWCLASAVFYLLTPTRTLLGGVDGLYRLLYLGDEVARILLPALTLHLFLVFPIPPRRSWVRRLVPFLYLPGALLLTLQLDLALTGGRWVFGRPLPERLFLLDRIEMFQLAVFAVAAVAVLAWRLRRGQAWEQQRQMQWVAFGLGGGYLPFLLLYGLPAIFGLHSSELLSALAVLPLGLVPLTFAYAILRYKLWDIEVIVRDTISMTLTLLLGIIGFSLVNLAISRGVAPDMMVARNLLMFVAGLSIAGLLVPTRKGISGALERFQYRSAFGKRRALSELGRELLHERDLGRLCTTLLRQIEDGVDLEKANLWLAQGDALVAIRAESEAPERLAFDVLGEAWERDHVRFSGVALPMEPPSTEQRLFVAGYRYAFPLTLRGRAIGLALTGFKVDHTPLNSDDMELIRQLLDQAALAIENAQLLGQLHLRLEEVQSLQRYTEGIFESSPAGIAVLDPEQRIASANAAFAALAGQERPAFLGRSLADVLPVTPLPAPGELPREVRWRDRTLQVSLAAFAGGLCGREDLRVLVVHDVTERVAMEKALQENERLAALGMLAAGVAHEVNTPITGISSYAQMLLAETPENDPHYEILKKVERQTFRAASIVNNLLELARNRQKESKPVAVAPLLRECVELLADRIHKQRVEVVWDIPEAADEDLFVFGCDGELQQVFTNLLLNASDAVAGPCSAAARGAGGLRGRIEISLEAIGGTLSVRIRDNGPGIAPDKLEAIFQPFYSTKLNRGGTGLGLSISSEIVHRHGGALRAESAPGGGACFIVELPRHGAGSPARTSETSA
ncbi:MAG TPA: ATP-binding protein [Thermoanaerobaculia bacterium]|nr:ATP-binding protein [Thermoanaerobaculia bacterium]